MEIQQWLNETKANEIMIKDVVTLRPTDPLFRAASTLLRQQISGVPVVDEAGACVGVISASDFLDVEERVAQERKEVADSSFFTSDLALPSHIYEEKLAEVRDKIAPAAEQPIEHFMTTDSNAAATSARTACSSSEIR